MKTVQQIQILYELAMSIGKNTDIEEMLRFSILQYLRKLNCTAAIVYKLKTDTNNELECNRFFSMPLTLNVNHRYCEIDDRINAYLKEYRIKELPTKINIKGVTNDNKYYHLMNLPKYGFLALISSPNYIENEMILSLHEINEKLADACISCENNKGLVESKQKYRELSELLPEMVCEVNLEGKLLYANQYAIKKMGYSKEDIENGLIIFDIFKDKKTAKQNFLKSLKNEQKKPTVYTVHKKNGTEFSAIVYTNKIIKQSEVVGIRGVMVDISERISAEQKLKTYAERLELALFASDAGLWDWNIQTNTVVFNKKWSEMRGFNPSNVVQNVDTWKKMIYEEDKDFVFEQLNKHLLGEASFYYAEYRAINQTGNYIWIADTGKITEFDKNGNPLRMVGTNINITEKKTQELELQQNIIQQKLLSDIALALNGLDSFSNRINNILNKIGTYINVSRVYIFEDERNGELVSNTYEWCGDGITPQKDELQNFPYEIIPSWKKIISENGRLYSENISELPSDMRAILEPQGIISIIIYPLIVKGEYYGFVGFDECKRQKKWTISELELLRAISGMIANAYERKLFEQSLKESEAKNSAILESMPDILFHLNLNGVILNFKSSSEEELAMMPEHFIDKNIKDIFPSYFSSQIQDAITKCLDIGNYKFDYSININNLEKFYEARMSKMNEKEVIAIVRNISERMEFEKNITEERDKAKSEFLANISHEIRTPMNAILGFSEALYYDLENEKQKKMVKSILSSGNVLLSLLNDILDLSKIEADKLEISTQSIDFSNLMFDVEMLFKETAKKKGLNLIIEKSEDFPQIIELDEVRIKQVLFNLIGNALKFTHKGFVKIQYQFNNPKDNIGELEIKISDSGIGIPEKEHEAIFEAFRQQNGQSNRQYSGTGLGLTISNRLIKKMNGTIELQSELGKGSVFTIKLPNTIISNNISIDNNYLDNDIYTVEFYKSRILIVDDVLINIESVKYILANNNLEILSATNSIDAFEIVKQNKPDIILQDLRMPNVDGYEIASIIKKDKKTSSIPIIAYTASTISIDVKNDSDIFDGYLLKPLTRSKLLNLLIKFLPHSIIENKEKELDTTQVKNIELNKELQHKLINLITILKNEFIPKWNQIKNNLVIYRIEEFINELNILFEKFELQEINTYCTKLYEAIDIIDLDEIDKYLLAFPDFIDSLSCYLINDIIDE